jgi:hypothetical protein
MSVEGETLRQEATRLAQAHGRNERDGKVTWGSGRRFGKSLGWQSHEIGIQPPARKPGWVGFRVFAPGRLLLPVDDTDAVQPEATVGVAETAQTNQ